MAGEITRTVLAEINKYIQVAPVVSAYSDESVLFDLVKAEVRTLDFKGRTSGWLRPARKTRAAGFYSRAEGGTIGTAIPADYAEQVVPARYLYWPITLTGPAREFGRGKEAALIDATTEAINTANLGFARNMARVLWGTGTGHLCLINGAVSAGTTIAVDTPGTQYLSDGMILDVGAGLDDTTISSVDSGTQFTASASQNYADNDIVYIDGNKDIEPMGLGGILYDGTTALWGAAAVTSINGLTRSSNIWTYANGTTAAGNNINSTFLPRIAAMRTNGGANKSDRKVIVTSPGVCNSLYYLADNKIHYNMPTATAGGAPQLSLGRNEFSYNGIKVIEDPYCPESATTAPAVFLNLEFLEMNWTEAPHLDPEGWLPGGASTDTVASKLICYTSGLVATAYKPHAYVPGITINNASAA
jgi:hypothetical protein